ncbi:MAG: TIGR02221 family CRISPR-associated protein [Fimbriimonadia bacterium]|nr:TIGR02221 family CRISPR-associated protein [Fimbriimonadia bacterium]
MKLLTFVGTGSYKEVSYQWKSLEPIQTAFFAHALSTWLNPEEILVFLTQEAEKHPNWEEGLKGILQGYNITPVPISSGKSDAELWEVFDKMVSEIDAGSEVVIDVTHAFRSIPMLAFVAAAFMTRAKAIHIKHILYGAFEAQDSTGIAPVFDLTPFMTLLDWMNATDQFIQSGDSRRMASILKETNDAIYRNSIVSEGEGLPTKLSSLSGAMTDLSQALLTVRTDEIPKFASKLPQSLDLASKDTEKWVQPLDLLIEQIREKYAPFQRDDLESQRALVDWYVQNDHVIQAVTLAREWLVSWSCARLKVDHIKERLKVEACIKNVSQRNKRERESNNKEREDEYPSKWYDVIASERDFLDAWRFVRDLRNDVAHCGIRKNPDPSSAVYKKAQEIPERLSKLRTNF